MEETFNRAAAHRAFAGESFNKAWDYLDAPKRTPTDVEAMIHASHASLWHWLQVPERTEENLSVGNWQLSRVYAVAGNHAEAERYGQASLEAAERGNLGPFFRGYAFEALARAAAVAGNRRSADAWLAKAAEQAARVAIEDSRKMLEADLAALRQ